jgi:hypothetical protein
MHLRFTIRDLLLLTAVVALVIGWWLDHKHMARELSAFQQEMKIERKEFALYSDLRWQRVDQKQEDMLATVKKLNEQVKQRAIKDPANANYPEILQPGGSQRGESQEQ